MIWNKFPSLKENIIATIKFTVLLILHHYMSEIISYINVNNTSRVARWGPTGKKRERMGLGFAGAAASDGVIWRKETVHIKINAPVRLDHLNRQDGVLKTTKTRHVR